MITDGRDSVLLFSLDNLSLDENLPVLNDNDIIYVNDQGLNNMRLPQENDPIEYISGKTYTTTPDDLKKEVLVTEKQRIY